MMVIFGTVAEAVEALRKEPFTIVTDAGQNNAGVIAVVGDTFTISITDTKVGPLPEAGGKGLAPYAVLGLLLILTGAAYHHRNFRVRGRHAPI